VPAAAEHANAFTIGTGIVPEAIAHWLRRCWDTEAPVANLGAVDVSFADSAPDPPQRGAVVTTTLDGARLTWLRLGERRWQTSRADAGVELQLDGRSRVLAWPRTSNADFASVEWSKLAIHLALCEAQRARGLVPLHAAVIVRDGRATALVGRSGAGKSTALLDAIDAGWSPLAEDFAWLDPVTRRVSAWKGDRGVRLTDAGLSRLSARWQSRAWRREPDRKLLLAYADMRAQHTRVAELTRIVLLQRDATLPSSLETLAPRDATRALWESAGVPLCRINRDAFAARAPSLLSGLVWQRLVVGRGPSSL
jgi:hypothetical protein